MPRLVATALYTIGIVGLFVLDRQAASGFLVDSGRIRVAVFRNCPSRRRYGFRAITRILRRRLQSRINSDQCGNIRCDILSGVIVLPSGQIGSDNAFARKLAHSAVLRLTVR